MCDGDDEEVETGGGADTSLGLRLNKLHDVHLSYPLPLMRRAAVEMINSARGRPHSFPFCSAPLRSILLHVAPPARIPRSTFCFVEDVSRLISALRLITVAAKYKA